MTGRRRARFVMLLPCIVMLAVGTGSGGGPRYIPADLRVWYSGFPACMSGPVDECALECRIGLRDVEGGQNYDADGNKHVDLADFALIQVAWPCAWFAGSACP